MIITDPVLTPTGYPTPNLANDVNVMAEQKDEGASQEKGNARKGPIKGFGRKESSFKTEKTVGTVGVMRDGKGDDGERKWTHSSDGRRWERKHCCALPTYMAAHFPPPQRHDWLCSPAKIEQDKTSAPRARETPTKNAHGTDHHTLCTTTLIGSAVSQRHLIQTQAQGEIHCIPR